MKAIIIFLTAVLIIGLAYYFIVYRKKNESSGTAGLSAANGSSASHATGLSVGNAVAVQAQLGFGSTIVNASDTSQASSPSIYFNNLTDQNVNSYNVLTSPSSSPNLIHYKTGFNNQCAQYIWYKKSIYVSIGTNTDNQGNKTCYYKFDKSILPTQLKVQSTIPPYQCSQYKYYIGGVEYKFSKNVTDASVLGSKYSCIYVKQ